MCFEDVCACFGVAPVDFDELVRRFMEREGAPGVVGRSVGGIFGIANLLQFGTYAAIKDDHPTRLQPIIKTIVRRGRSRVGSKRHRNHPPLFPSVRSSNKTTTQFVRQGDSPSFDRMRSSIDDNMKSPWWNRMDPNRFDDL